MSARCFIDTNVLLYLMSADTEKADRAEQILAAKGYISVQVLNEIANVARRKLSMSWDDIDEFIGLIRTKCPIEKLSVATHDCGRAIAQRYGLSLYDAMIVAAALLAECTTLYSEDMQHGLLIEGSLTICNPFRS